jgi:hypothetical protein
MRPTKRTLLGQCLLLGIWETANQLLTGAISDYGSQAGIEHARQVVAIERAHGFFVEPTWQQFVLHSQHILGLTIPWRWQVQAANAMYALGHPVITIAVAFWIFFFRTNVFPVLRNAIIGADMLALIAYRVYPMAPPRMTSGLFYNGHPFHFVDTSIYWARTETNQFAAMPSIHIAYATIVALMLAWTLRPPLWRALVLLYPIVMLVAVVATGNHFIMDGLGALAVISIALPVALLAHWLGHQVRHGDQHAARDVAATAVAAVGRQPL